MSSCRCFRPYICIYIYIYIYTYVLIYMCIGISTYIYLYYRSSVTAYPNWFLPPFKRPQCSLQAEARQASRDSLASNAEDAYDDSSNSSSSSCDENGSDSDVSIIGQDIKMEPKVEVGKATPENNGLASTPAMPTAAPSPCPEPLPAASDANSQILRHCSWCLCADPIIIQSLYMHIYIHGLYLNLCLFRWIWKMINLI